MTGGNSMTHLYTNFVYTASTIVSLSINYISKGQSEHPNWSGLRYWQEKISLYIFCF